MAAYWLVFGLITTFYPALMDLFQTAEGVAAKSPGALQQLQTAGNCKACHTAHRED